jgi:hypothetical protein
MPTRNSRNSCKLNGGKTSVWGEHGLGSIRSIPTVCILKAESITTRLVAPGSRHPAKTTRPLPHPSPTHGTLPGRTLAQVDIPPMDVSTFSDANPLTNAVSTSHLIASKKLRGRSRVVAHEISLNLKHEGPPWPWFGSPWAE